MEFRGVIKVLKMDSWGIGKGSDGPRRRSFQFLKVITSFLHGLVILMPWKESKGT